jgi:hypothetical protein
MGLDGSEQRGGVSSQLHEALQYWSSAVKHAKMFQLKWIHNSPGNLLAQVDAHAALHVHLRMLSVAEICNYGAQKWQQPPWTSGVPPRFQPKSRISASPTDKVTTWAATNTQPLVTPSGGTQAGPI